MITITSRQPGFRRCGIAHPAAPVDYPDDRFTEEELEALRAEQLLVVAVKDVEPSGKKSSGKTEKKATPDILDRDK